MGRPLGSRNKKTLLLEAEAKAMLAGTAAGAKALPTLSRIMNYFMARGDAEVAKPDGDPAVIDKAYGEARLAAIALAQYQSPRLSAVAVGAVTKMIVEVRGGLPPRNTSPAQAITPPATEDGVAGPADAGA
jgi:hypothetical protein